MEADLRRYYGVRLTDLWRGELSLRELSNLIDHLPPGSAVWCQQAGVPYGWTLTDLLITDLFQAFTGEPHPMRPGITAGGNTKNADEIASALVAQRERMAARKERLSKTA